MKRRNVYLKLTRHNGRAGTHGTYNPKHNDRSFNLANSEHIDPERAKGNIYWDCFHGFRSALAPPDPDDLAATFSDVERQFYESRYSNFVESQNERNAKIRHTERNRSIPDLLSSRKTCPEETIYQLGTMDDHASAEDLLNIVTEFIEEFKAKFGEHVHVLDWALHLDESTPHIHERHVFDCENKYGELAPQQEKALEALGFDLPDPGKPLSRRNNRKITFDAACRKMLFEIAKRHGLELEEEAEYGNRKYLEKQDFILAKQKEQIAAQQNRLNALTLKVSDMETLLEDVSAAAYDKAVEVVTDVVRAETRKEDMRMIEDTKKWVLSPERKAPKATREYTAKHLDTVLDKFLKTMQTTATRLQEKLMRPDVRQKGKEQVKEKARDSVLHLLSRLQAEQAQRKPSAPPTAEKSEKYFQYKVPYETHPADRLRQCVFAGTTNRQDFLPRDRTGNRRFIPVPVDAELAEVHILDNEEKSRAYIDQLWAEAMTIYNSGNYKLAFSPAMQETLQAHQQDFMQEDAQAGMIYAFLEDYTGDRVCSKQLYAEALGNTNIPAEWETRAICEIMNTGISRGDIQGWQAHKTAKRYPKYGVQKGWERVTSPETGAEDFSEITDAEAKQLGFPF